MFPLQPGGVGPAGAVSDLAGLQRRVQSRSSVVLCTGGSAVAGVAELADAADSKSAVFITPFTCFSVNAIPYFRSLSYVF